MKTNSISGIFKVLFFTQLVLSLCFFNKAYSQRKGGPPPKEAVHQQNPKPRQAAHYHYRHLPRRGAEVEKMDAATVSIAFKGMKLHYHTGIFYKPKGAASFVVVRPPMGIRIKVLPPEHRKIVIGPAVYFYYYGTFYKKTPNSDEYEVIDAPVGAEVDALPDGYETKTIDSEEYYELDDVYYKPKENEEGEMIYEVVEIKE
ncbi:MAG: DUF6515 family protein [Bacteroidota bacterium]